MPPSSIDFRSNLTLSELISDEHINFVEQVKDTFGSTMTKKTAKIDDENEEESKLNEDYIPDSIDFSEFWTLAKVFFKLCPSHSLLNSQTRFNSFFPCRAKYYL